MINNQQQTRKRDIDWDSPILIHRRPTIENIQQSSLDIDNVLGNQLQLTRPRHVLTRNKSSRGPLLPSISLKDTKSFSEDTIQHMPFDSKLSQSSQISIWTPVLQEKEGVHPRILRSKNRSLKHYKYHQHYIPTDKNHLPLKHNCIPDLYISSKSFNNNSDVSKKPNLAWEEPIAKTDSLLNREETLATTRTAPVLIDKPQIYIQEYDDDIDSSIPRSPQQLLSFNDNFKLKPPRSSGSRRHSYTNTLPTVAEYIADE